ncbi:MAG: hypothetical protein RBS34_00510 [Desulfofustis sp.]|jgi:hypothetical protein|nr:hypothetical protein [Desulfofustis sp.]
MTSRKPKSAGGGQHGNRARVWYGDNLLTFSDIAKREGLTPAQVYRRWKTMDRPARLRPDDFYSIQEAAKRRRNLIRFEGKLYKPIDLARIFGVSEQIIYHRRRRSGQYTFTRAELEAMHPRRARVKPETQQSRDALNEAFLFDDEPKPAVPRNIHDVEYTPHHPWSGPCSP